MTTTHSRGAVHQGGPSCVPGRTPTVTHTVAEIEQQIAHARRTMTAAQLITTLPQLQHELAQAREREEGA